MNINRKSFFDGFRAFLVRHGKTLTRSRVDALNFQLDRFEADKRWFDRRHIAYALATECIETDWTFEPIQEYGTYARFERLYGSDTRKGRELGNDAPGEGAAYSGKGYVQETGESNYEKAEAEIRRQYPELVAEFESRTGRKFDLTVGDQPGDGSDPDNAKEPHIAFAIMTLGMHQGWFTGKKLSDYINVDRTDYVNARRIINGVDRAAEIAELAKQLEQILNSAAALVVEPALAGNVSVADPIPVNDPQPSAENGPPPTTSVMNETKADISVEEQPKGQPADAPATQVSQNGGLARKILGGSTATAVGGAVLSWATGHIDGVAVIAICVTVLLLAILFRGVIIDYVRMQSHADPDKYNVK